MPPKAKTSTSKAKKPKNGRPIERTDIRARPRERPEATVIPSHGHGRLAPFRAGEPSANPGGRPSSLKEVQQLARKKSINALHALIACYETPTGKIARDRDPRVVAIATQAVMKWAYGEPPAYDPTMEKPEMKIDLSGLTLEEKRILLAAMDRVSTVVAEPGSDDGPSFDVDRFEPEPVTIEADAPAVDVAPPPPSKTRANLFGPINKGRLNLF